LPESGYFVNKVRTTRVTMFGRSFLENNDPKPAVALIKKTLKVYPYLTVVFWLMIDDLSSRHGQLLLGK